jgi:hypothetical protein
MMSVSPIEVALPSGRLSLSEDGDASVLLRLSIRNRDALLAAVNSTSGLPAQRFWLSGQRREDEEGLHLSYPKPPGSITPLTRMVELWRAEPAVALARALELARHLLHVTSELEQLQSSSFPLSPAQVFAFSGEDGKERWLVLPLPLERTAFADFVRADENYWAWLSADEMFGAARTDRAYMTGAALYYCLVAPLFPAEVSRAERVRRLVLYRAGNPYLLRAAVASALPESEAETAGRLSDLIAGLLAPPLGRALTPAQALRELDRFCVELSPHRLACLWEVAGDDYRFVQRAHAIIEALASTTLDSEVPWDAVERLREKAGDQAGAADASARRRGRSEESSVIDYARSLLGAGEERREDLERLTNMVREMDAATGAAPPGGERGNTHADAATEPKPGQHQLSEEEYLYLTYVHGRWLCQADEALRWLLRRDFSISWNRVVRCLLAARFTAGREESVRTSAHCRDGRRHIGEMSNAGGAHGRYATAYLDLLDGIAHVCAVHRQNHASDYLSTAFDRLRGAWEGLRQVGAMDEEEALTDWLSLLAELAGRDPRLAMLGLGVEAFLQSGGAGRARVTHGTDLPPIPWFEEPRVFTSLSDGGTM